MQPPNPTDHPGVSDQPYLQGGGEMGALMRAHDWSRSSLGPPEAWPQSLRTMVRLILNTGHPMYIWWGADGACLYNDAYRASIGPERHPGSLGRPAREVWEEIWPIIGPQIEQVREGRGPTWNVDHLVPITRHGRREDVYWTYSYSPIDDAAAPNGIGGVLVVCSETTRQVQSALQLAAERDELGRLFEQSPAFMAWLSGPQHRFEIANPAYLTLVGNRHVLGRTVAEALPETLEQGYIALLDEVFASGEPYRATGARVMLQADDHFVERHVDFVYQPIRGADGLVRGVLVIGYDVSERVAAESSLRTSEAKHRELSAHLATSNRMKDEFLATLAHELRNPLAPMLNALAIQRRVPDRPDVVAGAREIMERQIEQMVRLVDDLLDMSRLSRGIVELRRAPIALADALAAAVETSRPLLERHGHSFEYVFPDTPVLVDADSTRIVQVFANLLNNAAKFTPRGGHVRLSLACEGEDAVVRVRDSGIGLPSDMLQRVFEMFTQVDRSHAHVGGGLGIGLTIVRQLVEGHGGRIEARSEGPGRGAEFVVRLPLPTQPHAGEPAEHAPTCAAPASGLRIVIADDNVDAALSLALLLGHAGHAVHCVHDGAEALAAAKSVRPQAMVLDIAMPGLDGHALGRAIRAEPWGRDVLLIAASGWGQQDDVARSLEAGFDHHLVKPVDVEVLEALLQPLTVASAAQ
jgi:signal transduction histidine kinase/ActR/RegA family two-component response regulator